MRSGFTLLEVLVAVFIVALSFGAFLVLAGRSVSSSDELLKTCLSTLEANNALNEAVYGGKLFKDEEVNLLGYRLNLSQDFEELMGFRVVKIFSGTPDRGYLVELYEVK
jgi:general secretion pathway protein I